MSASTPPAAVPRPVRAWHGAAVFLVAMALFLLLPQRVLHGVDGNQFVVWIEEGNTSGYARHAAYLQLGAWVYAVLEPLGAGGHLTLLVLSALGSAIGLVFLLFAFARLLPAHFASPLAPTVAVLATPACFYYATTAEIAGVFAAGAGAAWWTFSRWLDRKTIGAAMALGAACAVAGALHALGHLMTPALMVVALLLRRLPTDRRITQLLAWAGAHAAVAIGLSAMLASGATGQAQDAADVLSDYWQTFAPLTAPAVFMREWIVPYLPWSIGALAALWSPRSRPYGLAVLAMIALYLPPNVVFLGHYEINEAGAYFITLTPLAVLATAHFVTARGLWLACSVGAIAAVLAVSPGWRDPMPPDFGDGIRELNREHKIALVVVDKQELAGARTSTKGLMAMELAAVVGAYIQIPAPAPPFSLWFDDWHDNLAQMGMTTVLSASAKRWFEQTTDPQLRPFWREHVPAHYEVRDVQRQGFHGIILTPR